LRMADRICSIPECGRPHLARGWCGQHYERWKRYGDPLALPIRTHRRHGLKHHPLYTIWSKMWDRCRNPANKDFARYGGRGIVVCSQWADPEQFIGDMSPRPAGTTLDRKDNDGPYSPENCQWATRTQQMRNCRQTKINLNSAREIRALYAKGMVQTALSKRFEISQSAVSSILTNKTWREVA
jgi:hypothetical protein